MIHNFRDLGGLETKCQRHVRDGLVFRTGNLSHIDEKNGRYLAEQKKLRVYIDFRSNDEIRRIGKPEALIAQQVEWIHLEVDAMDSDFSKVTRPTPADWLGLYKHLFEKNTDTWLKFVNILAEADAPVAYGCVFGKDRTGIATSILLEALNVHDEQITRNYCETTAHIEPLYQRFQAFWENTDLSEKEIFEFFMKAPEEVMREFLPYLRRQTVRTEAKLLLEHIPFDTRTKLQLRLLK